MLVIVIKQNQQLLSHERVKRQRQCALVIAVQSS